MIYDIIIPIIFFLFILLGFFFAFVANGVDSMIFDYYYKRKSSKRPHIENTQRMTRINEKCDLCELI